MQTQKIVLVAAVARNGVIGRSNGDLPWHLPSDLSRFRRITWGKPLIVGRRTFEAIGRPLPGRRMVVVTRDPNWRAEGVDRAKSLASAFSVLADAPEIVVAGGADVYEQTLRSATCLRITHVELDAVGDVRFPTVDWSQWRVVTSDRSPAEVGLPGYRFADYARVW